VKLSLVKNFNVLQNFSKILKILKNFQIVVFVQHLVLKCPPPQSSTKHIVKLRSSRKMIGRLRKRKKSYAKDCRPTLSQTMICENPCWENGVA
jgi:hypothetical protein